MLPLFISWSTWAVPRQFVVNGDSGVLSLCSHFPSLAVFNIGRLDDLRLVGDPDVFTFV